MADPVFNYVAMNPFGLSDVGFSASPAFADIDGDSDPDAFVGTGDGNTLFFRNTGTASNPVFAAASTNPFGLNDVGNSASPTLADIDGDGDLDAFIGNNDGNTLFFRNTGTAGDPVFAAASTNAFGLSDVGSSASPTLADIDGDGDLDAFVGNYSGDTLFFKNSGTASNPLFAAAIVNPFGLIDMGGYGVSPRFVDIDDDGDLDAFLGWGGNYENSGGTLFYRNTGTTSNPVFYHDSMNPFGLSGVGGYRVSPAFVDIDGDSDVDAFIGGNQGNTLFLQNTGMGISPHFSGGWSGVTVLQGVGYNPNPTFADIDGDGDLDAFVGKGYSYYDNGAGDTLFFENTGTASKPVFAADVTNPFGLSNVGSFASPTFVDIDEDGDLDAFVGDEAGNLQFFRNTGTASSPVFAAAITNPFGLSDIGNFATSTFVDIDSDGDLDTFVKDVFYRNTGTASNPVFAAPEVDPFGLNVGGTNLAFVDVDGDGDLDAFDSTQLFRNTGTASNPAFTYAGHPFGLSEASYGHRSGATSHTFVDIDGDGDLDVYVTGIYSYNRDFAWDKLLINNNAPNVANLTTPEVYTKNTH